MPDQKTGSIININSLIRRVLSLITASERAFNRLIESLRKRLVEDSGKDHNHLVASEATYVNLVECADEYLIKVELPYVGKDDVKVMTDNGVLSIVAKQRFDIEPILSRTPDLRVLKMVFAADFVLPFDANKL